MAQKIEIPLDLNQAYVAREGATVEVLTELAQEAQDRAIALLDANDENPTDEQIAQATYLHGVRGILRDQKVSLEETAAERKRLRDELRGKVAPTDPEGEPAPEPTPSAPEGALVPVTAAAAQPVRLPSNADIARAVGTPQIPSSNRVGVITLTAASDVPGLVSGSEISMAQVGQAFDARARGMMSLRNSNSSRVQHPIASIRMDAGDPALVMRISDRTEVWILAG